MATTQQERLQTQKGVADRKVEALRAKIAKSEVEVQETRTLLVTAEAEQAWLASHPLLNNQEGPSSLEDGTNDPAIAGDVATASDGFVVG